MDCEGAEYEVFAEVDDVDLHRVSEWMIEYHGTPDLVTERLERAEFAVEVGPESGGKGLIHAWDTRT